MYCKMSNDGDKSRNMQYDNKQKNRVIFNSANYVLKRRSVSNNIQRGHQGTKLDYPSHKVVKSTKTISVISCMCILYFILIGESDS